MSDQRRRPDPTSRPDPYELAVRRGAQEPGPDGGAAPPLPRLTIGRLRIGPLGLVVGILVLVLLGGFVRLDANRSPAIAASCSSVGLAVSRDRVQPGGLVRYTLVGPDGARLQLRVADQQLPPVVLRGCRVEGSFGVQVAPGEHQLEVLRDGRVVASRPLTVTEPGDPGT